MFPTGTAGTGLLLLRSCVATTLLVDGTAHGLLVTSIWTLIAFLAPALLLYIGLLTPYCCCLSCIAELIALRITGAENEFHLLIAILTSASVAMLGPGAYSLDARIFGRRLLSMPARPKIEP